MKHNRITTHLVATLTAGIFITAPVQSPRAQNQAGGEQVVGVARLTPEVRASITKGLEYLAKEGVQKADGSWGSGQYDVAETSLGLMAFMLKGYVPGRGGRYGVVMDNAITYLINKGRTQRGFLGTPNNHAGMYEHGLAFLKAYPNKKFEKGYPRFHYAHYYAIQAMYQTGETDFQAWYPKIAATVVSMQEADGSWSGEGGKAYATGASILIIGVPYRFLPIYQR